MTFTIFKIKSEKLPIVGVIEFFEFYFFLAPLKCDTW